MSKQIQLNKDLGRVSSDTMADVVESRLRDYFKKKSFKPGDALPKELELAEALGVSRNVVREALSRLRMLGMIESRKKRGMILASPDILGAFERVLDPLIITEETLQDLFELRLVLEMGLADVLFINITPEHLKQLDLIVEAEVTDSQTFRIKNEIAFHGKLYEIAGNDTLKRFQNMLLPIFGYVLKLEKELISGTVSHKDLVDLLKGGDKEKFRMGMHAHLKPHFDKLEQLKK
ncbi:FadR/GntR family transcriptional regulator [Mucilaginibacter ginkgonis]|nr:GntR family transcriptional regulator [Mucilaginibacter ginkgonis]